MRAAYIEATGGPEVIRVGELPNPEPGPGQVQVRVRAASLNPINLYIRSGMVAMPLNFPYVIASDLAGTVEKIGPKVTRFAAGDRVWGSNQGLMGRQGVAAELAAEGRRGIDDDDRRASTVGVDVDERIDAHVEPRFFPSLADGGARDLLPTIDVAAWEHP